MAKMKRFQVCGVHFPSIDVVADGFRVANGDLTFHVGKGGDAELIASFARGEWGWVRLAAGEAV